MNTFALQSADDARLCDLEPITRLDRIQSFGFLIATSSDWRIVRASENLGSVLGIEARAAIGTPLDSLLEAPALHEMRNRMFGLHASGTVERIYGLQLVAGRPAFDVAVHYVDGMYVLEGEIAGSDDRADAAALIRSVMGRLSRRATVEDFHWEAAREIRALTGFDRVMIYRFAEDNSGVVLTQAAAEGMESYLDLHFPASDIPAQARALYLRNPFRIIADVAAPTVVLLPANSAAVPSLDLSLAITRAVSPTHLEYLRNMDVAASLSISIIIEGQLWGLIACHHRTARCPSFVVRTAAELFGQMYSMTLESRLRRAGDTEHRQCMASVERLVAAITADGAILEDGMWLSTAMREMIPCDGVALLQDGHVVSTGLAPAAADILALAVRLRDEPADRVFATDHLRAMRSEPLTSIDGVAGLLAIPISRDGADQVLLFRGEQVRDIKWAGMPEKILSRSADGTALSPRKSFAMFSEFVVGRSQPFSDRDLRMAEHVRAGLTEVMSRAAPQTTAARDSSTQRQELLIAELNHRVRNILALIRGLISQTHGTQADVSSYVESLSGRVQALARAHDRVTRQNWGPDSINALFEDEIAAYVPTTRERLSINGAPVLLRPLAFSTLALVIHELVTNCLKYGSLSAGGRVDVHLQLEPARGLTLRWREIDGPDVVAPTRRGFGSVIIERIVPFDLQGTAVVRYAPAGLEADFFIPEIHLVTSNAVAAPTTEPDLIAVEKIGGSDERPIEGLEVLLLEDNLIVALEAEDLLRSLGARTVATASTVAAAEALVTRMKPAFAVLDINLGFETSLAFAGRLTELGIPFIFASGYGERRNVPGSADTVVTVAKPYDREQLRLAVRRALAQSARRLVNVAR